MLTKEREDKLIKVLQKFIQASSYSGNEGNVVSEIKKACLENGYDEVHVDEYGSIIATLKGKKAGPTFLYDGHIDTVPVGKDDKWEHDPFGGEVVDGKLYGRGTTDMKGSVASMIMAGAYFASDTNKDFAGTLHIAGVVHEECFEGVAARKISEYTKPDYVLIGEASELNLKIGQRGRAEIVVETFGVPAHSANPHKGVNAVYLMSELISRIRKIEYSNHPKLGLGILELTDIKSSPYPGASVVPSYCRATYDRRLLVGETLEGVIEPIQNIVDSMSHDNPSFKAKVSYAKAVEDCYTGNKIEGERFFPGWIYDENEEFVQKAFKALESSGLKPTITQYSFCTNGSHYGGEAHVKTFGFGPSTESLAHTIDEYIELEQLFKSCNGFYHILKEFLK